MRCCRENEAAEIGLHGKEREDAAPSTQVHDDLPLEVIRVLDLARSHQVTGAT